MPYAYLRITAEHLLYLPRESVALMAAMDLGLDADLYFRSEKPDAPD